ncbi:hypothetical protein F190043G2_28170 [Blautia caecimuris]|uniref:DUF6273 domain-containing protein n=1 Tax=Blautia caecimuris TaxID=1796615 RepID=UPI0034B102AA
MDIMKESTLQSIASNLQLQNALLAAIAGAEPGSIKIDSFAQVQELVSTGLAEKIFAVGDQLICPWTDIVTGETYDWVWDIVHMADVELEDGSIVPGMYLQAHYLTPFSIQFDAPENEIATETTFQEGLSYYLKNEDGSFSLQTVTAGEAITEGATYYHSAIKDTSGNICRYGYNRWSHSAYRQFLNSDAEKGAWWTPQHAGDVAPNELNSRAGFLSGFEEDFLSAIRPVKVRTWLNTVTDKEIGDYEDAYDKIFLASKEQVYGTLESGAYNDEVWDYYKKATGLTAPSNADNIGRIKYKLDAQTSADWQRLRSPSRGGSYGTWNCNNAGNLNNNNANNAGRCAPDCDNVRMSNLKRRKQYISQGVCSQP